MIAVMNRIPVNPEYAEAFEARFSDRAALVDGMEGFVAFRLMRPGNPEDPYIVMTFWESTAHFEAWTRSAEFKEGMPSRVSCRVAPSAAPPKSRSWRSSRRQSPVAFWRTWARPHSPGRPRRLRDVYRAAGPRPPAATHIGGGTARRKGAPHDAREGS